MRVRAQISPTDFVVVRGEDLRAESLSKLERSAVELTDAVKGLRIAAIHLLPGGRASFQRTTTHGASAAQKLFLRRA